MLVTLASSNDCLQFTNVSPQYSSSSVNGGLQVKLADCALSRDLYPGDYHCLGDNHNRPIKWLALESLTHKVFSPASDVVSQTNLCVYVCLDSNAPQKSSFTAAATTNTTTTTYLLYQSPILSFIVFIFTTVTT